MRTHMSLKAIFPRRLLNVLIEQSYSNMHQAKRLSASSSRHASHLSCNFSSSKIPLTGRYGSSEALDVVVRFCVRTADEDEKSPMLRLELINSDREASATSNS